MHVGIIGCGQLARMMALAGWNMGLQFSFLAEEGESIQCVKGLGNIVPRQVEQNAQQIYIAMGEPDVITVERELVDAVLLRELKSFCRVFPDADAIHICQNRLREKALFTKLDLPTAPYASASTQAELIDAVQLLDLPVVIKSSTAGYDGKHQWHIHNQSQLEEFASQYPTGDWLVESHVPFDSEMSVLAARSPDGEVVLYPPTANHHQDGILITSVTPAPNLSDEMVTAGYAYIGALLESMDYVGLLAMECFVVGDKLLINELAPRVHNSGHWTLQSEATSQFENHLRAILNLRLGSTDVTRYDGIINILGSYDQTNTLRELSADSSLTDYNKSARPLRKLGHINVSNKSYEAIMKELNRLHGHLYVNNDKNESPSSKA